MGNFERACEFFGLPVPEEVCDVVIREPQKPADVGAFLIIDHAAQDITEGTADLNSELFDAWQMLNLERARAITKTAQKLAAGLNALEATGFAIVDAIAKERES